MRTTEDPLASILTHSAAESGGIGGLKYAKIRS